MINNESNQFGITFNPNSILVDLKRKFMDFIQGALPSHKISSKTVCGNITVHERKWFRLPISITVSLVGHCANNLLNFKMAKFMIQGYILVTPDTPLVRSLIEPLNKPLQYANLLRDMAVDLKDISMDLQDELARSDLNTFATVIAEQLFKFGLISNKTEKNLKHLFHNSSDPDALFPRFKDALNMLVNSTSCIRFDRFMYVENEHEMEKLALCLSDFNEYFTGIVFPELNASVTELPPFVSYKIRHNSKLVDCKSVLSTRLNRYCSNQFDLRHS